MLATAHCSNRYTKPRIYENEWIDNHSIRVPWLNFLTAQPIPEETDVYDYPKHIRSDSDCSSSSIEDCYIVLEVPKPRSIEEHLSFAQINEDEHHVEYEQLASSMIIEVPEEEHAVEHRLEKTVIIGECERVVQRINYMLFHTLKNPDESILVSADESSDMVKLETNDKINEHESISNPTEQQSIDIQCSITSLASIETRSSHVDQQKPIIETSTFTRTLAFDHTCIDKYNRVEEQKMYSIETNANSSISKTSIFRRLIKNHTRIMKSKYDLSNHKSKSNEPSLIQIKYLDGRTTLTDIHAQESYTSSRLSLSTHSSYRKRIFNHFQTVFKPNSTEPWQRKSVFGLFNERKSKANC